MLFQQIPIRGLGKLFVLNRDGSKPPVLITHGTFSNAQVCAPIAHYFADQGRPVYVIEWRGRSGKPGNFNFEELGQDEITHALQALPTRAHLLAHSGGGLAMIFALRDASVRRRVASLTLLGTQATHLKFAPLPARIGIQAMARLGRIIGHWPTRVLNLGPCNESSAVLDHWLAMNSQGTIKSRDGQDVLSETCDWGLPVLSLAGAADKIIAPEAGCRSLCDAFGPTGVFHLCQKETDGEDFSHTRLMKSRNAARFVWPRSSAFMDRTEEVLQKQV